MTGSSTRPVRFQRAATLTNAEESLSGKGKDGVLVDLNRASWNRVTSWLHDLERLRRAA